MSKSLLLLSGGLDSITLAHYLVKVMKKTDICCLFINYGQGNVFNELECVKKCISDLQLKELYLKIDMHWLDVHSQDSYIPHRNTILLANALSIAEAQNIEDIYVGFIYPYDHRFELFLDTTLEYVDKFNDIANLSGISINSPFNGMIKEEIFALYAYLEGTPYWSCSSAGKEPCGKCNNCLIDMQINKELYLP